MNKYIFIFGLAGLMCGYVMFTHAFITAAMNGGTIIIHTNNYGEQTFELIMQAFFLPFVVLFLWKVKLGEDDKNKKN